MKIAAQIVSYLVLLGGSLAFGFLGRPTEMGIAVLAGALGLAFSNIDKIARFKGAGFEAEMRERLETIAEKETEPDVREREFGDRLEAYGLVGDESPKVVRALLNPSYTWRYVGGIREESGVSQKKIHETLEWLMKNGLARSSQGETGRVWALTAKGRNVFASLRS